MGVLMSVPSVISPASVLGLLALLLAAYACLDSLSLMVTWWQREEYSHSYLIPFVAAFLVWQRLPRLLAVSRGPSWVGLPLVALALGVILLGEMSAIYTVVQYGFIALLPALAVAAVGVRGTSAIAVPLAYLLFMVPLPNFLYNNLSQALQLVSSAIGVEVIRLFGISVHLEGNIIDLGTYQLQVVEACSGLRYLFPLMSLGLLVAYLFQAPFWQRALVFLSTVPITVLMNSFRIGVIGILVEHRGIGMAEGFLHAFEGWVIFMSCFAVLMLEIWLLHRISGAPGSVWERLDLSLPDLSAVSSRMPTDWRTHAPLRACVALLAVFVLGMATLGNRTEEIPPRSPFLQFPLLHNGWLGREEVIDVSVLHTLNVTDYLVANYRHPDHPLPVNLYMAFYQSQRKGTSVHSPRSCIPGGGWVIEDFRRVSVDVAGDMSSLHGPLRLNRVMIRRGPDRQLVYYWFQQRGRALANEYAVKWFIFWDSMTRNRTDGALVRLVVPVPEGTEPAAAERQLGEFLRDFHGLLERFVPD